LQLPTTSDSTIGKQPGNLSLKAAVSHSRSKLMFTAKLIVIYVKPILGATRKRMKTTIITLTLNASVMCGCHAQTIDEVPLGSRSRNGSVAGTKLENFQKQLKTCPTEY
jgi:hypothetical protein